MTLNETIFELAVKTGMEVRTIGDYDVSDEKCCLVECELVAPRGVVVLAVTLSRHHHTARDGGWRCGGVGFIFSTYEINRLIGADLEIDD